MNGSPYKFFARRGTVNKLVMYYQGGGACWEQLTCSIPVCDNSVTDGDNPNGFSSGFADLSNPNNPFKDWNAVFVSYCSCDIHFGDAAQDYNNVDPAHPLHVEHRGYQNSKVAEKYAREHFLAPEAVFVTARAPAPTARGSTARSSSPCGRRRSSTCWPTRATASSRRTSSRSSSRTGTSRRTCRRRSRS
jgi:hypothetical protein